MEQGCRVYFSFQPIRGKTRSIHTRDSTSFFSVLTFTKNNAMNNKNNNNSMSLAPYGLILLFV